MGWLLANSHKLIKDILSFLEKEATDSLSCYLTDINCSIKLRWSANINSPLLQYFVDEPRAFLSRTPLNKLQSLIYSCISVNTTEVMDSFERKKKMINTRSLSPDHEHSSPKPIEDLFKAKIRHLLAIEILRNVCWRMSYIWHKDESSLKPLFLLAAENGIYGMVETILDAFPRAIKLHNDDLHSALHIAAMYRHEKIFSIALQKSAPKILNLTDKKEEVLFFRVAHNALQSRLDTGAGVVFRMQRELRWYKELEKIVSDQRKSKNNEGKTPIEVGYENKWILEMANSCIVGASLTIDFTAIMYIVSGPTKRKDAFIIAVLALIPIVSFGSLQLPSLINMMRSTYWHHPFFPSQLR
ncbi:hypothetical protein LIER_04495 [Lithospermum erythrorhizon]|uniref:Ankyrin repeat protein n=1 Tax=Lithospermum erythrorhizon TaxID=34254 RepID=A0AAV3NYA3_LITER